MNSAQLPVNLLGDFQHIHLQNSLYNLQLSLTEYFCAVLPIYFHGLKSSLQDPSFIQIERLRSLDWESPGDSGLQSTSFILKKMEEAMVNDLTLHGRETAPNRELLDVFKCLWTYFRLGAQRDPAITSFATIYQPSSRYHDQEWGEFEVYNRGLKEDCEVVTQILQHQTRLLKTNGQTETLEGFNPSLRRILIYLRHKTIRPHPSCPTSYEADKVLEDLDWILR
ncbi:unnamed protein product [Porites evermanni]|uniref:Uncharacterized protein n=1 Tax=Porites evermanni TaxID=104178 RepID=A0ABN8MR75_9CNID|nr:unnamed protein product [Porites evermanni]